MGVALIQTFHAGNFSDDPLSQNDWHLKSKPDLAWITATVVGLVVFLYGFIGFWLCERKRKLWRINLHRMPPLFARSC